MLPERSETGLPVDKKLPRSVATEFGLQAGKAVGLAPFCRTARTGWPAPTFTATVLLTAAPVELIAVKVMSRDPRSFSVGDHSKVPVEPQKVAPVGNPAAEIATVRFWPSIAVTIK